MTEPRSTPTMGISVRSLDSATPTSEVGALEARLDLLGATVTVSSDEMVIRIPMSGPPTA